MKKHFSIFLASLVIYSAPAEAKKTPVLAPLELQALQSREFETSKDNLFGAVMTVLQDMGYQVISADVQTGFITAASATQNKTSFLMALAESSASGNTKVTCFLQSMPNGQTKVRLNFLNSRNISSMYGQSSQEDKPIMDVAVYANAWDKIDEALFVMGALQAPVPGGSPGSRELKAAAPVQRSSVPDLPSGSIAGTSLSPSTATLINSMPGPPASSTTSANPRP